MRFVPKILAEMAASYAAEVESQEDLAQPHEQRPDEKKTALSALRETYCKGIRGSEADVNVLQQEMMYGKEAPLQADQNPLVWWKTVDISSHCTASTEISEHYRHFCSSRNTTKTMQHTPISKQITLCF